MNAAAEKIQIIKSQIKALDRTQKNDAVFSHEGYLQRRDALSAKIATLQAYERNLAQAHNALEQHTIAADIYIRTLLAEIEKI